MTVLRAISRGLQKGPLSKADSRVWSVPDGSGLCDLGSKMSVLDLELYPSDDVVRDMSYGSEKER